MRNWKMILSFPFLEESKRERERGRIRVVVVEDY